MTPAELKNIRRDLFHENQRWPLKLKLVPKEGWPGFPDKIPESLLAIWRSRNYFVQVHKAAHGIEQLVIMRTNIDNNGQWAGGILHSEIQDIKRQCGFGHVDAVELYPADKDRLDTEGVRYVWLMPRPVLGIKMSSADTHTGMAQVHNLAIDRPMSELIQPEDLNRIIITDA
jgi:hypothetical protein